jgi:hypothetical protein
MKSVIISAKTIRKNDRSDRVIIGIPSFPAKADGLSPVRPAWLLFVTRRITF